MVCVKNSIVTTKKYLYCSYYYFDVSFGRSMSLMTLQEVRHRYLMTQEELARKLRIRQAAITHWECGRRQPSMKNQKKIARLFGLSPEEILQIFPLRSRRPRDAA